MMQYISKNPYRILGLLANSTKKEQVKSKKRVADHGEARYTDPTSLVRTFILILNRVRNNLFHGGKSFRVEGDIELLECTCPLLRDLTKICIDTIK